MDKIEILKIEISSKFSIKWNFSCKLKYCGHFLETNNFVKIFIKNEISLKFSIRYKFPRNFL